MCVCVCVCVCVSETPVIQIQTNESVREHETVPARAGTIGGGGGREGGGGLGGAWQRERDH